MGGCATKPKVLKGDDPRDDVAPAPIPVPSNSPPAPIQKEKVVKEAVVENDAKEGVPVVVDHDSATKNSSLGNLFKENQDSAEKEKETVKVADVSETTNTPKEVEKTIPEDSDSSLKKKKKKKEEAEEKKTDEEEEVVGESSEKKKPDEVNVVTPEEQNLDPIKPKITDPEEKMPEEKLEIPPQQQQQQQQQPQQEEKEEKEKETEESMKQNPPPPPPAGADQEKIATPKGKPEENNAIPKVVEVEVEEDKKKKPEEVKQKTLN